MDEVPAPPVVRMLMEYLPTLPARNTFNGKVYPPPFKELFRNAVNKRNLLAHRSDDHDIKDEELAEIIAAIRDTLWLLDYYCGNAWALGYVRESTRKQIEPG